MKVFINKLSLSDNYCGGLIVVAANSAAEAHGVMCMSGNFSNNYLPDKWQELEKVSADVDEPQVLAEDGLNPCE